MIEPETQIRAVGFHSREGQGYISGLSAFPFYCSLLLKDSEGAKVHLLILLPAKHRHCHILSSVQFSCSMCLTLCDPMYCSTPGFLVHCELLELAQTHVHWDGDAVQPSHPLMSFPFSSYLQSFPASVFSIRLFSNESVLQIRWPKYWSFSF